jgi:hypothetical protein
MGTVLLVGLFSPKKVKMDRTQPAKATRKNDKGAVIRLPPLSSHCVATLGLFPIVSACFDPIDLGVIEELTKLGEHP